MAAEQSWRLKAELRKGTLNDVVAHVHRNETPDAADAPLPPDVVVTHDGSTLWAYAASEASIESARKEVEALPHQATVVISHWDQRLDDWVQVDPALSGQAKQRQEAHERSAERPETRTMVASAGRLVRSEIEQTMRECADTLHLELSITEHPHLLSCQVLFEVTGQRHEIDEFSEGLNAFELATMRTERAVMMSPL